MTIVGKILVFVNLVFSLLVGWLVIGVYATRFNYYDALNKERAGRKADVAAGQAYMKERDDYFKQIRDEETREKAAHERVANLNKDQQETIKSLQDSLNAEKMKFDQKDAIAKAAAAEVDRRQKDVEKMRVTLKEEMDKVDKLVKSNNEFLQVATAAKIERDTLRGINTRLEEQLQNMARDNARMKANSGATTTAVARDQKNPPTEKIEGLIKTTDPSGLVKITLGSDAGLVRGHTMEVFRIDRNNPQLSKYLGTLRIIDVNATEAVAQPMGKMLAPLREGDSVASRILGS